MKKILMKLLMVGLILLGGCFWDSDDKKNNAPTISKLTIGSSKDFDLKYGREYVIELETFDSEGDSVEVIVSSEQNTQIENLTDFASLKSYTYNTDNNLEKNGEDKLYIVLNDGKNKVELSYDISITEVEENAAPELLSLKTVGLTGLNGIVGEKIELIIDYEDPEGDVVLIETISPELILEDGKLYYIADEVGERELSFKLKDDKNNEKTFTLTINVNPEDLINFMVYIAGDNNLGRDDYGWSYGMQDIMELSQADLDINSKVKTVILIDFENTYERTVNGEEQARGYYEITNNDSDIITFIAKATGEEIIMSRIKKLKTLDEIDTGKKESLKDFINYSTSLNFSHVNVLSIWGHGDGWYGYEDEIDPSIQRAIAFDDGGLLVTSLSIVEVKEAIKESVGKVEILYTDACLMGMAEVAYEWKDICDYFVTSPELTPGEGGDYEGILKNMDEISKKNEKETIGKDIAIGIQEANYGFFDKNGENKDMWKEYVLGVVYSVFDQSKADEFFTALNNVGEKLSDSSFYSMIEENYTSYSYDKDWTYEGVSSYADLGDFLDKIDSHLDSTVETDLLRSYLNPENENSYLIYLSKQNEEYPVGTIISNNVNTSGMAIYFPINGQTTVSYDSFENYKNYSSFARDYSNGWMGFLEEYKVWHESVGGSWED